MKLISICILLLAALAWSNIFSIDAGISFENGYLNIDTTKTCNVDTSYINCSLENGLAYYSTLDTAVAVFFMPRIAQASVYALQTAPNTRSLTEILRYEFIKWVEWGIIVMTKDSAQRLLDRVLPDTLQMNNCHIFHKKVCDTDPSQCSNWGPYGGGLSSGLSDEDAARLPQKKILGETAEPAPADTSAKTPVGEQSTDSVVAQPNDSVGVTTPDSTDKPLFISRGAPVGGSLLGLRYSEFDANGVFIRSGIWQGSLKTTGSTRIVRFENGKTAIFR
ncbi:MAG: hypothetical protein J5615_04845 [Fibrobacter sp.]|nr:hypothetical protein [Fibrobacter sp.]